MNSNQGINEGFLQQLVEAQKTISSLIETYKKNMSLQEYLVDIRLEGEKFIRPPPNQKVLRVYGHPYCPYADRIRLTFYFKNVPFQFCLVDNPTRPQWFKELGTEGISPIVELRNCQELLSESVPTCFYIDKTEVGTRKMMPSDPILVCKIEITIKKIDELVNEFYKILKNPADKEPYENLKKCFKKIDSILSKNSNNPFFYDLPEVTFADICAFPHLRRIILMKNSVYDDASKLIDIESYLNIMKWYNSMIKLDEIKKVLIPEKPWHSILQRFKEKKTFMLALSDII